MLFNVNGTNKIKEKLNPSSNLINFETNTESGENTISDEIFYPVVKYLKEKIAEYKAIPTKNFINESYFLYDKSNPIKKTFVSAINKQLSLYGSFSYFSGNAAAKNLDLITTSNFLKFFIEKNKVLKDNLKLQLAYVNGSKVETIDKKIHNFSITKLGKRRKMMSQEPIDTIIIRAQQDFDIDGGLNLVKIQIRDETILNQLKKYKNVVYNITPLGMLFPASIQNDTNLIFITANNISGVKKAILSFKTYDILAEIDVSKIKKWEKIKGQSIWINTQFKDHK